MEYIKKIMGGVSNCKLDLFHFPNSFSSIFSCTRSDSKQQNYVEETRNQNAEKGIVCLKDRSKWKNSITEVSRGSKQCKTVNECPKTDVTRQRTKTDENFQDEEVDVKEITKRNLGTMMIRFVGNEGVKEKPDLRRLFQACINFLQTDIKGEGFWTNASITIYDDDINIYKIASGTRKHQFICRIKSGTPIIFEKRSRQCKRNLNALKL